MEALGVGVSVEREWKSHVEGREKSRWERKKQIVGHCATSVSGRHCRVCVEDFCSQQLGMGSRLMGGRAAAACVKNSDREQKRGLLRGLLDIKNSIPTPSFLVFSKRQNSIGLL